jgi:hypothetical protein
VASRLLWLIYDDNIKKDVKIICYDVTCNYDENVNGGVNRFQNICGAVASRN